MRLIIEFGCQYNGFLLITLKLYFLLFKMTGYRLPSVSK